MSTDQPESRIELEVKNFGPIAEAKIDLRPLTVFVGPNNTGKSYLATLIYALHAAFVNQYQDDYEQPLSQISGSLEASVDDSELQEIEKWISASKTATEEDTPRATPPLPKSLCDAVRKTIRGDTSTCSIFAGQISRAFGIGDSPQQLIRFNGRRPATVIVRGAPAASELSADILEYRITIGRRGFSLDVSGPSEEGIRRLSTKAELGHDGSAPFAKLQLLSFSSYRKHRFDQASARVTNIAKLVVTDYLGGLDTYAYYLPADRTGIMHAHSVVVGALLDAAPYGSFRGQRSTATLSGVVSDFLREMIIDMNDSINDYHLIAKKIESDIMGGTAVRRVAEAGYPSFAYSPSGQEAEIPLLRVSSMVSELTPVVLYLKHLVEPGDTLIIDEPEAHLHPAAQVGFAKLLAKLVGSGVKVILTTHSNWIVDEFANLVRVSELEPGERSDLPGEDAALSRSDVGVWKFDRQSSEDGSTVKEIDFDPDGVGYEPGYLGVADQQYNTWAEINNRLADRARRD